MNQKRIDWKKCQRVNMISRISHVPKGQKTSLQTVKLVLLCIEDHLGDNHECWPSEPTIAQFAGVTERAVRNAIAWLQRAELLVVELRGRIIDGRNVTLNHYSIMWNNLFVYGDQPATDRKRTRGRSETGSLPIGNETGGRSEITVSDKPPTTTTKEPSRNPQRPAVVQEKVGVAGGFEGDYDRSARLLGSSFRHQLSKKDKQILNRVLDDVQAGYVTAGEIDNALVELSRSEAKYPVSVFEAILERQISEDRYR